MILLFALQELNLGVSSSIRCSRGDFKIFCNDLLSMKQLNLLSLHS